MKLAWFRADGVDCGNPLDDTAHLLAELGRTHTIDVVCEADAHTFVWKDFREPYELCVFEIQNTPRHWFIWPYLFHYPGVLLLQQPDLHDCRAMALERHGRSDHYEVEFTFNATLPVRHGGPPRTRRGTWPMLRAPLLASRSVVVPDGELAATLQAEYPGARVRHAPIGVPDAGDQCATPEAVQNGRGSAADPILIGTLGNHRIDVIERALQRALRAGTHASLLSGASAVRVLQECDIVLAVSWPDVAASVTPALAAMAAAKPVVVVEAERTAAWPALDPQTWKPRGASDDPPIVVSIDPRDEEHSIMLAIRWLSADPSMRAQLGAAARAWWSTHATIRHAADAWEEILRDASANGPPPRPPGWPAHLNADGTAHARKVLSEYGAAVDLFS